MLDLHPSLSLSLNTSRGTLRSLRADLSVRLHLHSSRRLQAHVNTRLANLKWPALIKRPLSKEPLAPVEVDVDTEWGVKAYSRCLLSFLERAQLIWGWVRRHKYRQKREYLHKSVLAVTLIWISTWWVISVRCQMDWIAALDLQVHSVHLVNNNMFLFWFRPTTNPAEGGEMESQWAWRAFVTFSLWICETTDFIGMQRWQL